jgi:hypothetical protein
VRASVAYTWCTNVRCTVVESAPRTLPKTDTHAYAHRQAQCLRLCLAVPVWRVPGFSSAISFCHSGLSLLASALRSIKLDCRRRGEWPAIASMRICAPPHRADVMGSRTIPSKPRCPRGGFRTAAPTMERPDHGREPWYRALPKPAPYKPYVPHVLWLPPPPLPYTHTHTHGPHALSVALYPVAVSVCLSVRLSVPLPRLTQPHTPKSLAYPGRRRRGLCHGRRGRECVSRLQGHEELASGTPRPAHCVPPLGGGGVCVGVWVGGGSGRALMRAHTWGAVLYRASDSRGHCKWSRCGHL